MQKRKEDPGSNNSTPVKLNLKPTPATIDNGSNVARNKRLVPVKMLSVDTGIRGMLRREANTK